MTMLAPSAQVDLMLARTCTLMRHPLVLLLLCFNCTLTLAQDFDPNEYVTGMTAVGKPGADPASCPPIVWIVEPDTPAAEAGIRPGDRILAINGHHGVDVLQARTFLHSKSLKSLAIDLESDRGPYSVQIKPIQASILFDRGGWKVGPDGGLYPKNASEAEMRRISNIAQEPPRDEKAFNVSHYPSNLELYYPGFEIFVWKPPQRIMVGGIEKGPASKAGVHYGDEIVLVNGIDPNGKQASELERLFSSQTPARMTLLVDRDGEKKTFVFELSKASDIARENQKKFYQGRMIPASIPDAYLHCFSATKEPQ